MKLDNFEPNYWLLFIIITWLLLILSIVIYKWKEKYLVTTAIGVRSKRNVCLKFYMKEKIKYLILILLLSNCSKDISFDPTVTIGKELIRFFYEESKERPVMEWKIL